MSSAFTCFVEDGKITSGKEFVKLCAQRYGVETKLSDTSNTVEIISFDHGRPSNEYFSRRLKEEEANLEKLKAMEPEEIEAEYNRIYAEEMEARKRSYDRASELAAKYGKIMSEIVKWQPAEQYEELKYIALDQLRESAPDMDFYNEYLNLKKVSPFDWYKEIIKDTEQSIEKYAKRLERVDKQIKDYDEWCNGLEAAINEMD